MTKSPTLVGLHGLGGDRSQPLSLLDEAVRSTCMVFAPDLRAHGACDLRRPSLVSVPVVVLTGDRDPDHPVRLAEDLATDLRAEMRLVPPRYDRPEEHARVVAREIRRVVEEA